MRNQQLYLHNFSPGFCAVKVVKPVHIRKDAFKIANAGIEDIESIVKITRSKENRKALPWVMKVVLEDCIKNPEKNILLVAKNKFNEVIGFVRLYCRLDKTATLHEIAVKEDCKNKGIGTNLLKEAEKTVKKKNSSFIQLKTLEELADVHKFYLKNGFDRTDNIQSKKRLLVGFRKPV